MDGFISVVFIDIYMCKMEDDVLALVKPIFYKHYFDDTQEERKEEKQEYSS